VQLSSLGVVPDVAVLNPVDAQSTRLVKNSLGDYIFGSPSDAGAASGVWGLRIIEDANMPAGKFLVGQSSTCELLDRQEATIGISFEHSDYFTRNLCAIRCEARVGLGLYVPNAWVVGSFSVAVQAQQQPQQSLAQQPPAHTKR
jgi:HK97 family phage major capsid protein